MPGRPLPSRLAKHDRAVPIILPGWGAGVMPTSGSSSSEQRRESGVYPFYPHQGEDHGSGNQGQADRPAVWAEMERALHDELGVVRNGLYPIPEAVSFAKLSVKPCLPSCK